MKRIASIYTNCSLGGMASVYRTRARANPDIHYDLVFTNDAGGVPSFEDLPNVEIRIVPKSRLSTYVKHMTSIAKYDEVGVTLLQEVLAHVNRANVVRLVYEIHTPNEASAVRDAGQLDAGQVDAIRVPSATWGAMIAQAVSGEVPVEVVPNLLDRDIFRVADAPFEMRGREGKIPLLWIGRLDNAKNPNDMLRVLKILGEDYFAIFVLSLESDPQRMTRFLSVVDALGVAEQTDIFLNLAPENIASVMNGVRLHGGTVCSTSLEESYGYVIPEASLCGASVVAYDVGAIREHQDQFPGVRLVSPGGIVEFAQAVAGAR